jgi:hypothetical protein
LPLEADFRDGQWPMKGHLPPCGLRVSTLLQLRPELVFG